MAVKKYSCAGRAIDREARKFVSLDGILEEVTVKVGGKRPNDRFRYIKCDRKYHEHGDVPFCGGAKLTEDPNFLNCRCIYAELVS